MTGRTKVALIFGGDSSEHEISCLTAGGVLRATDPALFEVTCVGIAKGGRWVRVDAEDVLGYAISDGALPSVPVDGPDAVLLRSAAGPVIAGREGDRLVDEQPIDVAFALLHGPFGEDGTIQGLFEMLGLRYVGAGVTASALCQDKLTMKMVLAAQGLPVGPWVVLDETRWRDDNAACVARVESLGYPVFVKPARGGSSIGISRVDDRDGLAAAVELARRHDPKVIVEKGFVGVREIECAVLDNPGGEPLTSLPGEIVLHNAGGFYDFAAKYLPGEHVSLQVPADLDPHVSDELRSLAAGTFRALGIEGLARVDTFVTAEGQIVINELNTMPGFTRTSMYPRMWEATGVDYTTLITRLIRLAADRPLGLR